MRLPPGSSFKLLTVLCSVCEKTRFLGKWSVRCSNQIDFIPLPFQGEGRVRVKASVITPHQYACVTIPLIVCRTRPSSIRILVVGAR